MTCNEIRARDLVEQYLRGQLTTDDSSTFEIHYFDCASCFAEVETTRQAHTAARRKSRREPIPPAKDWLLIMAKVAVAGAIGVIGAMIWQYSAGLI